MCGLQPNRFIWLLGYVCVFSNFNGRFSLRVGKRGARMRIKYISF